MMSYMNMHSYDGLYEHSTAMMSYMNMHSYDGLYEHSAAMMSYMNMHSYDGLHEHSAGSCLSTYCVCNAIYWMLVVIVLL